MKLLLIDWGNTHIKVAVQLPKGGALVQGGALPTSTPDPELRAWLTQAIAGRSIAGSPIAGRPDVPWVLGLVSVVDPPRTAALMAWLSTASELPVVAVHRLHAETDHGPWMAPGLGTGDDRRAHLWGLAQRLQRGSASASTAWAWSCGTASVIDQLEAGAWGLRWAGGSIAPGLGLVQKALSGDTAALAAHLGPAAQGQVDPHGLDTPATLARGIWGGLLGPLLAHSAQNQAVAGQGQILLHGGWAGPAMLALQDARARGLLLPEPVAAPDLVFEGLAAWLRDAMPGESKTT